MDRTERLLQEAENELVRIHSRHQKEWDEIIKNSQTALSRAGTVREIKKVSKENKRQMNLLRKKQKNELLKIQRDFTQSILSC